MKPKHTTREQWLHAGLELLKPVFTTAGFQVPKNIRVSCGFPSKNPLGAKKRAIGECWADSASEGKMFEIFVSPTLSKPLGVLDTLAHEMVHATVGLKAGHKKPFKDCCNKIGLTKGKPTHAGAGDELTKAMQPMLKALGAYPHDKLDKMTNGKPKEGCRLLKASCPECGYVVRVTRKWIEVGLPTCCCGGDFQEGDSDADND